MWMDPYLSCFSLCLRMREITLSILSFPLEVLRFGAHVVINVPIICFKRFYITGANRGLFLFLSLVSDTEDIIHLSRYELYNTENQYENFYSLGSLVSLVSDSDFSLRTSSLFS